MYCFHKEQPFNLTTDSSITQRWLWQIALRTVSVSLSRLVSINDFQNFARPCHVVTNHRSYVGETITTQIYFWIKENWYSSNLLLNSSCCSNNFISINRLSVMEALYSLIYGHNVILATGVLKSINNCIKHMFHKT